MTLEPARGVRIVAACLVLSACGPVIQSARFTDTTPDPRPGEILLYSSKLPECPYDEVGLITGKRRGFWTSLDQVLQRMRERAREMGGDAIVGLGSSEVVSGASSTGNVVSVDTTDRLEGTVIRFSDPECRR